MLWLWSNSRRICPLFSFKNGTVLQGLHFKFLLLAILRASVFVRSSSFNEFIVSSGFDLRCHYYYLLLKYSIQIIMKQPTTNEKKVFIHRFLWRADVTVWLGWNQEKFFICWCGGVFVYFHDIRHTGLSSLVHTQL